MINTQDIFSTILDYVETEGIVLTQAQVDIIQHYSSLISEELEAAE
jgi:hypothetical protein